MNKESMDIIISNLQLKLYYWLERKQKYEKNK